MNDHKQIANQFLSNRINSFHKLGSKIKVIEISFDESVNTFVPLNNISYKGSIEESHDIPSPMEVIKFDSNDSDAELTHNNSDLVNFESLVSNTKDEKATNQNSSMIDDRFDNVHNYPEEIRASMIVVEKLLEYENDWNIQTK